MFKSLFDVSVPMLNLKRAIRCHVRKWFFKSSYHFLGVWVPIMNSKKSSWGAAFASDVISSSLTCMSKSDNATSK